jgi:hypothetical protein
MVGSSSAFVLAWRNYSPRSITPPRFYEHFCVPQRLGTNWGYWPSDSVFDQWVQILPQLLLFRNIAEQNTKPYLLDSSRITLAI